MEQSHGVVAAQAALIDEINDRECQGKAQAGP